MTTPDAPIGPPGEPDPILERRDRIRRMANSAQRLAYVLLGVAMVVFFVGLATEFGDAVVTAILVPLIAGSLILAVAIQVAYAIRGAERHETDAAAQRPNA